LHTPSLLSKHRVLVPLGLVLIFLTALAATPALAATVANAQTSATNTSTPNSLQATYGMAHLWIITQSANGQPLTGYTTVLYKGGSVVAMQFSPGVFTLARWYNYTVQVENSGPCTFNHWADTGSTNASRTLSITRTTYLTAIYSCTTSTITVAGPVPVVLNQSGTGLILIDVQSCSVQDPSPSPSCPAAIQADTPLVAQAVGLGMPILFTHEPAIANYTLPFSLTCATCTAVIATTGDKFLNTTLGNWIKTNHLTTVIIVGGSTNSGVLIAATQAVRIFEIRVVIPEDAVIAANPLIQEASLFLMLNIGNGNLNNVPLAPGAVTLTTAKMISFT